MGFKDGSNNILDANEAVIDQHVWLPPASTPAWLAGGTYMVVRKIAILIEDWDRRPWPRRRPSSGGRRRAAAR